MIYLISFFVLLSVGLFFSEIFNKLNLPYVIALIIGGILIGPVFNILKVDPVISIVSSIGVIFLMFIAGCEVKMESFSRLKDNIFVLAILNGGIPFVVGFTIGNFFGFELYTSLGLGAVFISSSIAVIIPTLEQNKLLDTRVGKMIVGSTIFEDVGGLIFLAILLQNFTEKTPLPTIIYVPTIIILIVFLKTILPRVAKKYYQNKRGRDLFESELRFIFVVLLATVLLFELLGMHAIIAGFIIGLLLSESIKGKIEEKVRTISYGFFIPIFFIALGVQTDLSAFYSFESLLFVSVIVVGLITSKIVSGYIGGILLKFSKQESLIIGVSTVPQLSVTLAAAYVALEYGIFDQNIISALIVLTMVTVFFSPLSIKHLLKKKEIKKKVKS